MHRHPFQPLPANPPSPFLQILPQETFPQSSPTPEFIQQPRLRTELRHIGSTGAASAHFPIYNRYIRAVYEDVSGPEVAVADTFVVGGLGDVRWEMRACLDSNGV